MAESWRVCMICTIRPIAHVLAGALREQGHEPVALVAPRPAPGADEPPEPLRLTPSSAPAGVDLLFARDKWSIERLLRAYEPDLTVCWGFPWKLPQGALDVARLGSVNQHPALLPRHRGPIRSRGHCAPATPTGASPGIAWTLSSRRQDLCR